jgi:leader peptidase (prepilin peptidase) / N-methyltransferase
MLGLANAPDWLWPIVVAPFIGSFMGVVIVRLPREQPVVVGRSLCPHCETRLAASDLVPVLSFVLLRGRCRYCHAPIGWFHPLVELAAVAVAVWAAIAGTGALWIDCVLGWSLLTLAWIDWDCLLLPDVLTLPLLLGGLVVTLLRTPSALADHCLAAISAYLLFQGVAYGYRRLRHREALGGGDAKLLAAAGAWCGLAPLPFVVLVGAVCGLLTALGLAIVTRVVTSTTPIPFGPCIALAFWLAWLYPALANGGLDQALWAP